ncbi:MAG: hypothetical protein JOZ93_10190 [Sinobacteraceae bacterium]|nr:hypothetical protein [Nevskiaceae bacterium]
MPARPLALFIYMYVVRRGFLDGRAGLALCVFHAFQEFMVGLKLGELRRLSARPQDALLHAPGRPRS